MADHPHLIPYPDSPDWFFRLTPAGEALVTPLLDAVLTIALAAGPLPTFPRSWRWEPDLSINRRPEGYTTVVHFAWNNDRGGSVCRFQRIDNFRWSLGTGVGAEEFERAVRRLKELTGE